MGKILGNGNYRIVIRFYAKKTKIKNYDNIIRKEFACKTLKSAFYKIRAIQQNYGTNLEEFFLYEYHTRKIRWFYTQGA